MSGKEFYDFEDCEITLNGKKIVVDGLIIPEREIKIEDKEPKFQKVCCDPLGTQIIGLVYLQSKEVHLPFDCSYETFKTTFPKEWSEEVEHVCNFSDLQIGRKRWSVADIRTIRIEGFINTESVVFKIQIRLSSKTTTDHVEYCTGFDVKFCY